ncbi:MAG TPA: fumarylacetoacetate hydrolase family protein [Marisediminicola sp.]|nr:fumarylacetoacetate hydrolase family protein [Marisediminicola sp.]
MTRDNVTPDSAIEKAAERLKTAEQTKLACPPVRDLLGDTDLSAAYAVQKMLTRSRIAAGSRVIGRKIGLTSQSVQRQFGVNTPDFGVLFDDMIYGDGEHVPFDRFLKPRVEGEIAFVLGADLPSERTTLVDVLRATEFVLPAIEIVDSRIEGWDIHITDTIADNASGGAFALGTTPYPILGVDLTEVGMVLEHNGQPVSTGAGVACLNSPALAVAWLAREVAARGDHLCAGETILSGALGPMVSVPGPGRYRLDLSGLGHVEITFTGEESVS